MWTPSKRLPSTVIGNKLPGVRRGLPEGLTVICPCTCWVCLLVLFPPRIDNEEKEGGT